MSLELVHPTLVHPRTGEPLRAVGIVAGKPVWPIMGGDGTEQDANDADQDQDGDQDQDVDLDADNDADQDGDGEDARVKRANRQAAQYRTQLRETQQQLQQLQQSQQESGAVLDALRKALGGDTDADADADPAEQVTTLTGEVETLRTNNQDLQRQLLVYELALDPAAATGANPVALLDSRRFMDSLRQLDADAEDYRDQVAEAIASAVESNANLRAGQGSRRGGAENAGRSKDGTVSLETFQAMSARERSELRATNPTLYRKLADDDVASRKRR